MQVNPIWYNNVISNNKVNFGGTFYSKPVFDVLENYGEQLRRECFKAKTKMDVYYDARGRQVTAMKKILDIMRKKFSRTTQLTTEDDIYSTQKFVLINPLSNYTHQIPGVKFETKGSAMNGVKTLEEVADKLDKVNNYEVEFKMCQQRHKGTDFEDFIPIMDKK